MSVPHFLNRTVQWLQKRVSPKSIILMYHRVADVDLDPWSLAVTPEHFAEHLAVVQKLSQPISLPELKQRHQAGSVPNRGVIITFDDGYVDNLQNAQPLLEQYHIPATIFIVSGNIGCKHGFWWDELAKALLRPGNLPPTLRLQINGQPHEWHLGDAVRYSKAQFLHDRKHMPWEGTPGSRLAFYYSIWQLLRPLPATIQRAALDELGAWAGVAAEAHPNDRPLTVKEIHELDHAPGIELGAHTVTHASLAMQKPDVQRNEIEQSKADLEQMLRHPVNSFSYPYGDYTPQTVTLAQAAGFMSACTVQAETVWRKTHPLLLPRFEIQNWPGTAFEKRLKQWLMISG